MSKKIPLDVGNFYDFWVKRGVIGSVRIPNTRHRSHALPASRARFTGQLIDKLANGVLVFQVDYQTWNYPAGWPGPGSVAHMMSDTKKVVTKTRLYRVKAHQVTGLAKDQPAGRVPGKPAPVVVDEPTLGEAA